MSASYKSVDLPYRFVKKQYQPRDRVTSKFNPEFGRTHQSFKQEADINFLVDTWLKTGVMPIFNTRQPMYADVSNIPSFQDAKTLVAMAEQQFALLSDEDKERFDNDPLQYLEAVSQAQDDVGTDDPLDVTVPTDTNSNLSARKEDENAISETDEEKLQSQSVQSNRSKAK